MQRDAVRRVLAGCALVAAFADAPPERGGWGATRPPPARASGGVEDLGGAIRLALLVPVLLAVMVASALNLVLGGLWVVALLALLACRRRTAWLVLLGSLALAVAAGALGGLRPPEPTSYAAAEVGWLTARLGGGRDGAAPDRVDGGRHRRAPAARDAPPEEMAGTGRQLERRARVAIAASRELTRLRGRAPDVVRRRGSRPPPGADHHRARVP